MKEYYIVGITGSKREKGGVRLDDIVRSLNHKDLVVEIKKEKDSMGERRFFYFNHQSYYLYSPLLSLIINEKLELEEANSHQSKAEITQFIKQTYAEAYTRGRKYYNKNYPIDLYYADANLYVRDIEDLMKYQWRYYTNIWFTHFAEDTIAEIAYYSGIIGQLDIFKKKYPSLKRELTDSKTEHPLRQHLTKDAMNNFSLLLDIDAAVNEIMEKCSENAVYGFLYDVSTEFLSFNTTIEIYEKTKNYFRLKSRESNFRKYFKPIEQRGLEKKTEKIILAKVRSITRS